MATPKGRKQVTTFIGGVPSYLTIADNIEDFKYTPRTISLFDAVYYRQDGKVAKASAFVLDQTCIGLVIGVNPTSQTCQVLTQGLVAGFGSDLTPQASYYLSDDAGKLTTNPITRTGTRVQFIGTALNKTDMLLNPDLQRHVLVGQPRPGGRYDVSWNPLLNQFELG